jgi:hypothetical protein
MWELTGQPWNMTPNAHHPIATPPSIGYVILGQPLVAKFRRVGQYHIISNLMAENTNTEMAICMWLGPGVYFCH